MSKNRGLKDTIIALRDVKKGKPFLQKMQTFHIDRCRANNYIIGIKNSENILIENTDPIQHEIATYEVRNNYPDQTSNRPVTPKSSQVRSAFVRANASEYTIKCNLHPFLQTHGYLVKNPYYTVTDSNGNFSTWFDSKEKFYGGPRIDDPVEELQAFCDKDHMCSEK